LARRELGLLLFVLLELRFFVLGFLSGFLQQAAHLVHLLLGQLFQVAQPLRHLLARALAALGGREDEACDRAEHDPEEKRAETTTPLAHSPASASSGADTSAARGAAWESSFGLTYLSVTARVPFTRNCSNRNVNVFSRSAPIRARTSSGRFQNCFLNGPIAFLLLLYRNCSSLSPFFHSSFASVFTHSFTSRRSSFGSAG